MCTRTCARKRSRDALTTRSTQVRPQRFRVSPSGALGAQIGDITSVKHAQVGSFVAANTPLAEFEWEGYTISSGDELYHVTWGNTSGCTPLALPFSARVVAVNESALNAPHSLRYEDDTDLAPQDNWLLEVELVSLGAGSLLCPKAYHRLCQVDTSVNFSYGKDALRPPHVGFQMGA